MELYKAEIIPTVWLSHAHGQEFMTVWFGNTEKL